MKSILILWPSRLFSILTFIILICLSATGCHLGTSTEDRSVLEHYRSTHLSGFPTPPLDLPAPKPLTANIDEHDLSDLVRLAKASAKSGNNSQAAAWQYLAVSKGGLGRYELSRYLARLGKIDESFYWLEIAAMDEGLPASATREDADLQILRKDSRWPEVEQYLQKSARFWRLRCAPPGSKNNDWMPVPNS